MESFIVRIYRREAKHRARLVGVVEKVGTANRKVFRTIQELWTVLAGPNHPRRMRGPPDRQVGGAKRPETVRKPGGKP